MNLNPSHCSPEHALFLVAFLIASTMGVPQIALLFATTISTASVALPIAAKLQRVWDATEITVDALKAP